MEPEKDILGLNYLPSMTYERFKELWDRSGFAFECSPHLSAALVKAANGDHSDFDKIEHLLKTS